MLPLSLLLACTGTVDPTSDYELTVVPVFLGNQGDGVLALEPDVKVRLARPGEDPEIVYLGQGGEGVELEAGSLPPVPADTVVGFIAEIPGGDPDVWNRAATVAYGEATVTDDLATGHQKVELRIPVLRIDAVGRLGGLGDPDRQLGAAVARLPDSGSVVMFGGADPSSTETFVYEGITYALQSSDAIVRVDPTEDGWGPPTRVGSLPPVWHGLTGDNDTQGFVTGRNVGMVATTVTVEGRPMVLLTGGRYTYGFSPFNASWWFLWDPETEDVAGGGLTEGTVRPDDDPPCVAAGSCGRLVQGRSEHALARLGTRKVLVWGGLVGSGISNTPAWEIWSSGTMSSASGPYSSAVNAMPPLFGAVAEVDGGAVVCGGADYTEDASANHWVPVDTCLMVTSGEQIQPLPSLPVPLAGAALAPLPGGGLLATGGTSETLDESKDQQVRDVGPASAAAFRYTPSAGWRQVGDLVSARAYHRALPLGDGRVLLVGGTSTASTLYGNVNDPVRCTEIFDPETDRFTTSSCGDAGAGAWPAVEGDPVGGYAVLEGLDYLGGRLQGGNTYGIVGGAPLE
ncbi:MAG: hypothetical protein R3F59_07455 [Myxococcota bacterium]